MRHKVRKTEFQQIVSEQVSSIFKALGFSECEPGAFSRPQKEFVHGFGLTCDRSVVKFYVPVGVSVPALWPNTDYLNQAHYPGLLLSRRLGEFRNNMRGLDQWYTFYTPGELTTAIKTMYADFVEQADPWLETFRTLEDVANEFYRYRIGAPSTGEARPPDPFAWALYGWLLQAMGRPSEADLWLKRAYQELRRPAYMREGRLVREPTKGATQVVRSGPESRLEELLQKTIARS